MRHPIVLGLQFGDEGKGKITDVLAKQADWVIRFNGGNNAGHTLWLNGKKLVTHSVPSGVRSIHSKNFIGAGCVIDPTAFRKEIEELNGAGATLTPERLRVDYRAHVTLPLHLALDAAREGGTQSIGSTKRGIGPTYSTKMDRLGIRVGEVAQGKAKDKVEALCAHYNPTLKGMGHAESSVADNLKVLEEAQELFAKYVTYEITPFVDIAKKQKCVLEGAQGVLLDLDHGTYPYVTSSNTLPAYASVGTPFPMRKLGYVFGVAKAYLTRVGQGPFETELTDATGDRLREKGSEYGATTGRPRRIGWLNADELKTAIQLSDCSHIVLTKADVLQGELNVKMLINGKLENFAGWATMKQGESLHPNLETFVKAIEAHTSAPVGFIGTGPDREDLVSRIPNLDFWADT